MQQIATANPTKVKLLTLNHPTLLGKPVYGLEVSHNVAAAAGKPAFLLTGAHHAREWPTPEFTLEFVHDLLMHDGTRPGRDQPAREGPADRRPARQRRRLRPLAQPAERAEAQELPRRPGRDPDARRVHGDRERQPRRRQQPQLRAVLGRPRVEHEPDRVQLARRGAGLRAREQEPDRAAQRQPRHGGDQQPHARPAPAARAELVQRARRGLRPGRLPGACSSGSTTTSPAGRRARGPTSTTRPPAPPSSRPSTPTARSASRPRRRPASAATRRSTRRTRTSSTTTSASARATPARRCAASTTTRSRPRPSPSCTP